jgi:hypothetical protein
MLRGRLETGVDAQRDDRIAVQVAQHARESFEMVSRSVSRSTDSKARMRSRSFVAICLAGLSAVALSACASVSFERHTATSGTFKSSGWSITILQMDFPKGALSVARENASDANMANMVVENVTQIPSWPPLDWLFDIFSIRYASVSGTWGFTGQENQSPDAKP